MLRVSGCGGVAWSTVNEGGLVKQSGDGGEDAAEVRKDVPAGRQSKTSIGRMAVWC